MPPTPVQDPNAARVCGLHRISAKQQQLVTLRQLRAALDTSIHELEREHQKEHLVNRAFLVIRFSKATCDAFLGMAQTFIETFVPASKEAAKKVNAIYAIGTAAGDAAGTKMAGGKVDVTKKLVELAKAGSSQIKDEGYQLLADSIIVKAEVIHAAVNNDSKAVQKPAASYLYDLNMKVIEMGLEHAKHANTKHAFH